MDFLATQHLWLLYEGTATEALHHGYFDLRWVRQLSLGTLALSLLLGGSVWADSPSQTTYIAPPPGYHVNLRSGPGTQHPAVNTLRAGTAITLTGRYSEGWAELTDGSWVAGNLISSRPLSSAEVSRGTIAKVMPPPGYNVNIRSGPGIGYPAVNTLPAGATLTLTGRYSAGWAELTDGSWVAGNLIELSTFVRPQNSTDASLTALPPQGDDKLKELEAERARVTALQKRLQTLGYLPADFTADGVKGRTTVDAIRDFQRIHQLEIDGIAGPDTLDRLYSSSAQYKNADHAEVVGIQNRLQALGYLPADFIPDGVRGTITIQAIREFQQENGLVADGITNTQTLDRLYSANAQYRRGGIIVTTPPTTTATPEPSTPTSTSPAPATTVITPDPSPNSGANSTTETSVPELDTPTGARDVQVKTDNGSEIPIFSGPGTEYDLVGFLEDGATVTITGTIEGNWAEMSDGNWAYAPWLDL